MKKKYLTIGYFYKDYWKFPSKCYIYLPLWIVVICWLDWVGEQELEAPKTWDRLIQTHYQKRLVLSIKCFIIEFKYCVANTEH